MKLEEGLHDFESNLRQLYLQPIFPGITQKLMFPKHTKKNTAQQSNEHHNIFGRLTSLGLFFSHFVIFSLHQFLATGQRITSIV
jgi:hypothetical protein